MVLFKWLLTIFFILFVLLFALQNQEQEISVHFLHYTTPVLPLYLVVYGAFALGILFWFLFSAGYLLQLKSQIHSMQKENQKMKDELDHLRNASIEEELEFEESKETHSTNETK